MPVADPKPAIDVVSKCSLQSLCRRLHVFWLNTLERQGETTSSKFANLYQTAGLNCIK